MSKHDPCLGAFSKGGFQGFLECAEQLHNRKSLVVDPLEAKRKVWNRLKANLPPKKLVRPTVPVVRTPLPPPPPMPRVVAPRWGIVPQSSIVPPTAIVAVSRPVLTRPVVTQDLREEREDLNSAGSGAVDALEAVDRLINRVVLGNVDETISATVGRSVLAGTPSIPDRIIEAVVETVDPGHLQRAVVNANVVTLSQFNLKCFNLRIALARSKGLCGCR